MTTRVNFDLDKNCYYDTYSPDEYDRHSIDSVLYRKSLNKISNKEWDEAINDLTRFKLYEMVVHKQSVLNTKLP